MQEAAVLIPIYRGVDNALRLILVRRADAGIHGGQIAFPGGKRTPEDRTLLETAVRETREEIGIAGEAIELLEPLSVMETRTTGFRIYPFLAKIVPPPRWHIQETEIAEVLDVRVADLARPEAQCEEIRLITARSKPSETKRTPWEHVPCYRIGPHRLWGATYRILEPLIPRLLAEEWAM